MLKGTRLIRRRFALVKRQLDVSLDEHRRPPNYLTDRRQLDETLQLNTHIFSLENVDAHVNSRFVAKSRVGMIKEHATIALYNRLLVWDMLKGPMMEPLRSSAERINRRKLVLKPSVAKQLNISADGFQSGYEYLLQSKDINNDIENFLVAEKQYLMAHFESKVSAAQRNFEGIMIEMPNVYPNEKFLCNKWKYFNDNNQILNLIREPTWNSADLLKDNKEDRQIIISNDRLKEYFLDFKDDFSYFLCRYLKNNDIKVTDLKVIKVAEALDIIATKMIIDNNDILVIKRLSEEKYYTAYFPNDISDFWIVKLKNLPSLVYKRFESETLYYMSLSDESFIDIRVKPTAIKSIGEYMKQNEHELINNPHNTMLVHDSKVLFEAADGEATQLDYYGSSILVKHKCKNENKLNLWIISPETIKLIFVK